MEPQRFGMDTSDYNKLLDKLFEFTRKKNWKEVLRVCKTHPLACQIKLTKSEETALHIAVSNYHADNADANEQAKVVCQLVDSIPQDMAPETLNLKNNKGDTPLHLAAAVGSVLICSFIASKDRQLIRSRNMKGETPMFLAAHHGKMEAFLLLHELSFEYANKPDYSLCRRNDGDTVLHSTISREYFELAHRIISYYPRIVNSVNESGFSPLHILARMPDAFLSSSYLGLWDRMIYCCVTVHEIKKQILDRKPYSGSPSCNSASPRKVPSSGKPDSIPVYQGKQFKDENQPTPIPAAFMKFFKFAMACVLIIFRKGIQRIGKIREMKERHYLAVEIMDELLTQQPRFYQTRPIIPDKISLDETVPYEFDTLSATEFNMPGIKSKDKEVEPEIGPCQSKDQEDRRHIDFDVQDMVDMRETPFLLAVKMGITEMVQKILTILPIAIQDLDAHGKNALLLAVEYRQTVVYNLLMAMQPPEYLFYQLDKSGNSIMHLAAKYPENQTFIIPGGGLHMLWEIRWCEHVKQTVPPQCLITYNHNDETANEIFEKTHKGLIRNETRWLMITSESCTVAAVLIASVAYATSATVPGGLNQTYGYPILEHRPSFHVYSVATVFSLCFSVAALVFFLAILTSTFQQKDFRGSLPKNLLLGLICLSTSILAMLISFCTGHFFVLKHQFPNQTFAVYLIACLPVIGFAIAKLPFYFEWMRCMIFRVPVHSYRVYY